MRSSCFIFSMYFNTLLPTWLIIQFQAFRKPDSFKFRKEMFVRLVRIRFVPNRSWGEGERRPFVRPTLPPKSNTPSYKLSPNKVNDDHQKTIRVSDRALFSVSNFPIICSSPFIQSHNFAALIFPTTVVSVDINILILNVYGVHAYCISNNHMETQLIRL